MEPRETDIPGSALLPARGGRFLAAATLSDRGSDRPDRARHRRLTLPVVRRPRLPSHTDAPFTVGTPPATLEQLPSPKRRRWGRRTHRRMTRPFRDAYRSRLTLVWPGTAWDFHRSVWLAIVSRRNHHSPGRAAATNRNVCRGKFPLEPQCFSRLGSLAYRPGRNVAPPELVLPGPFVTARCRTMLAAYPSQRGKFEQGLPYGHGPARVGLDRSRSIDRTV